MPGQSSLSLGFLAGVLLAGFFLVGVLFAALWGRELKRRHPVLSKGDKVGADNFAVLV